MKPCRVAAFALVAGLLAALGLVGAAPAAQGHGGDPEITVEAVHPLVDGSFHFIVDMVYADDGDPISGKTVTATPTSPSGATGAAVTLPSSGNGVYQGSVPLPEDGTWTVKIASADPAGSIDYRFQVSGDTGTPVPAAGTPATTAPAATVPATTTVPTAAPATTATSTTAEAETETEQASASAAQAGDDDDGGGFPVVLVVIAAALVALAGVPLALRTIRKSTDADSGSNADADEERTLS